jgi:hypothetical protein
MADRPTTLVSKRIPIFKFSRNRQIGCRDAARERGHPVARPQLPAREEALVLADNLYSPRTQQMPRGVAATYEKLAQGLEQHAGHVDEM